MGRLLTGVLDGVKGYSFLRNEYEMNPSAAAGHINNEEALEEKGVRRAIVVPLSFRGTNITPQGSLSIVHCPLSIVHRPSSIVYPAPARVVRWEQANPVCSRFRYARG